MGRTCPRELLCPSHLVVPFSATYYDLEDPAGLGMRRKGAGALQSPWVGNINLEDHYFNLYSRDTDGSVSKTTGKGLSPPSFPGYRVAPVGQLQILVKSPTKAVKVFLVPYDLRSLPVGGRLLARERTYVQIPGEKGASSPTQARKEALRYALQLQFVCVPSTRPAKRESSRDSSTTRVRRVNINNVRSPVSSTASDSSSSGSTPTAGSSFASLQRSPIRSMSTASEASSKDFYVSRNLKVVFTSCPPEKDEILRIERTDEVVLPSPEIDTGSPASRTSAPVFGRQKIIGFSPGSMGTREEEWDTLRMKWYAREEMRLIQRGDHVGLVGIPGLADQNQIPTMKSENQGRGRPSNIETGGFSIRSIPPRQSRQTKLVVSVLSPTKPRLPTIVSRPTTPVSQITALPISADESLIISPTKVDGTAVLSVRNLARNQRSSKVRRESGSYEERMLSEELRSLSMLSNDEAE